MIRHPLALGASLLLAACSGERRPAVVDLARPSASPDLPPPVMVPPTAPYEPPAEEPPIAVRRPGRCPSDMAAIPVINGCIDRYEASAGKGSLGKPDGSGTTMVPLSAPGKTPIGDVTVLQAKQACKNAGKRLCHREEWRIACSGRRDKLPGRPTYPYGVEYAPGRCWDWHASDHGKRPLALTGAMPSCATPSGALDLSGNIGEVTDGTGPASRHMVRGGNLYAAIRDCSCETGDNLITEKDHFPVVGFRCCTDGLPLEDGEAKKAAPGEGKKGK